MEINPSFWCKRVQECFSMFSDSPSSLQHMLLYGPPGSGKTTSAAWLVNKIWGKRSSLMCISMNAADERSLDSIRQKVFPFLTVDWRNPDEKSPRFLILDECETLTEAAQLSLQTILNSDPKDVCAILICNSQSRIHPKLCQRLLRIRYDPPNFKSDAISILTRGDLRLYERRREISLRMWKILHTHHEELYNIITDTSIDNIQLLSDLLLICSIFNLLDDQLLDNIHSLYTYSQGTFIKEQIFYQKMIDIIKKIRIKFERL